MRMLHPHSRLLVVEPGKSNWQCLQVNLNMLNAIMINKAIGAGGQTYFTEDPDRLGCSYCASKKESSEKISTIKFIDLFNESGCTLQHKYLVKIDCEGCERHIFLEEENIPILKSAAQISFEVHFEAQAENTHNKNWLKWDDYNTWITEILTNTHKIDYYKSRKKQGWGHYCMVNRKDLPAFALGRDKNSASKVFKQVMDEKNI